MPGAMGAPARAVSRYSCTSRAAVLWKRAGLRSISPRSKPAVAMATFQPSPSGPSRCSTETRASSKNTSAKAGLPLIFSMGRTVTPGASMGTSTNERPRWRADSASVRNRPKSQWA
jgi:hypothetical protein